MVKGLVAYQVGLTVAVAISGVAAWIAWSNSDERGALALVVVLSAQCLWAVSNLAGSLLPGTELAVVSAKVVITAAVVLVAALLVFALQYTGRESDVRRETLALVSVEPVVATALVWTTETHGLFYEVLAPGETGASGLTVVYGPGFYVHTVYSYVVLSVALFLIVVFALRSRYFYQRQIAAIVVATLVPWGTNAVSIASGIDLDLTPVVFTVTGVAFTWAVVREEFLDITPIATDIVLDRIDTAVVVVDTNDRVVERNQRARELFEATDREVVGTQADRMFADSLGIDDIYEEVTVSRASETREFESGGRYFRLQSSPLVDRRDEVVGYALLLVDLTDQRRREEQLERRNDQLDRFVGVVSHDLRNPLQVASGRLDLAQETGDPEHFDAVERSHDRMERLIEDLLELARQDDDGLEAERIAVESVAKSAWKHVDTADARLVVDADGLTVDADPDRLSQLFENLFRNVVEHGGDSVTVTVRERPDGSGFVVEDDGPGFGDADVDSVFEDGYTTQRDGTGFGLSIVAEVADQHGWSVEASDPAGAGARIDVVCDEKRAKVS